MERETPESLADRLRPIFDEYRVLRAVLFGSLARGEGSRRSDVDLIVVRRKAERFLDRYDGILAAIARAIPERDVDLLIYTPEELAAVSDRPFVAQALREGRTIYESEQESA